MVAARKREGVEREWSRTSFRRVTLSHKCTSHDTRPLVALAVCLLSDPRFSVKATIKIQYVITTHMYSILLGLDLGHLAIGNRDDLLTDPCLASWQLHEATHEARLKADVSLPNARQESEKI